MLSFILVYHLYQLPNEINNYAYDDLSHLPYSTNVMYRLLHMLSAYNNTESIRIDSLNNERSVTEYALTQNDSIHTLSVISSDATMHNMPSYENKSKCHKSNL